MTARRPDLDRVLEVFLGDGPTAAPDRALDGALQRIAVLGQRRRQLAPIPSDRRFGLRLVVAVGLVALALVLAGIAVVGNHPTLPTGSPSPGPSALASSPLATPASSSAAGSDPYVLVIRRAINQVDHATGAAQSAQSITGDESYALLQYVDGMSAYLDVADPANVARLLGELEAKVARMGPELDAGGPAAADLRRTVTILGNTIRARPISSSTLTAGPYHSSAFGPTIVLGLGDGWNRDLDDAEVFALRHGSATLAFHHSATAATADAMAAAVGGGGTGSFSEAPTAATVGAYAGLVGQAPAGATLWYDARLNAYDPAPGDVVRIWIVLVDQQPLTIELVGPPTEVRALRPVVEGILGTMLAYEMPAGS